MRTNPGNTSQRTDGEKGFTLVELMVSVGLFAFGFASIINVSNSLRQLNTFVDSTVTATALAEARIEEIRAMEFSDALSGNDAMPGFVRTWTVTPHASLPLKTVTVSVRWLDRREKLQQVGLSTMISE